MRIKDLLNSNPVYVRGLNLGKSWPALKQSMDKIGQVLPVLTTSDYLIIDGARRVEAALALGWKTIEVVATDDWDTIIRHLHGARLAGDDDLPYEPMRWLEIADLCGRILAPPYQPIRHARAVARRRSGLKGRAKTEGAVNSHFNVEIARALGMSPNQLQAIRELGSAVRLGAREWDPQFGEKMRAFVEHSEIEEAGIYSTLAQLRRMIDVGPGGPREELVPARDAKAAAIQVEHIRAALGVLRAAGETLDEVSTINPAMDPTVAKRLRYELQVSVRAIHRLRNRLEEHYERENSE